MKKYIILISFYFLLSSDLLAQKNELNLTDSICWSEKEDLLKWADFQGPPDHSSDMAAGCAASIYVHGYWDDDGLLNFRVTNFFLKKDSWSKSTTSKLLLKHEKLHFDIAEVYARKIRKVIDSLKKEDVEDVEIYELKIQRLLKSRREEDIAYDKATDHGRLFKEQTKYYEKIKKELHILRNYRLEL